MSDGSTKVHFTGRVHVKLRDPRAAGVGVLAAPRSPADIARAAGVVGLRPFLQSAFVTPAAAPPIPPSGDLLRWQVAELASFGAVTTLDAAGARDEAWGAVRRLLQQPEVEFAEPDAIAIQDAPAGAILGPMPSNASRAWHLEQIGAFEAWRKIRDAGKQPGAGVLIAHLDTGYAQHPAVPLQRFVSPGVDFWDPRRKDASDPLQSGIALMPGHGTGTLCLLAANHKDYKGVALESAILPLRISPSVIHVGTASLARAIFYAVNAGAEVITISMGGLPSQLWADAVNYAYERGVVICAAAGNNFPLPLGLRTPSKVVYPARFNRVLAVTGIRHDATRYWTSKPFEMCGNYGEESDVCAPTPGVEWALPGGGYGPGAGTSTATPQVAGTAALWLSFHRQELADYSPIEKVEACRMALVRGAEDAGEFPYRVRGQDPSRTYNEYYGDGRLDVAATLAVRPVRGLRAEPKDDVRWAFWKVIGGLATPASDPDALADSIELMWASESIDAESAVRRALLDVGSTKLKERHAPAVPAARVDAGVSPLSMPASPPPGPRASPVFPAEVINGRRASRYIVVPPRKSLAPQPPAGGAMTALSAGPPPTRRDRLAMRRAGMRSFAMDTFLRGIGPAGAAISGGDPAFEMLDGVGAFIVHGSLVDQPALEAAGALVLPDAEVSMTEPTATAVVPAPDVWHLDYLFGAARPQERGAGIVIGVLDTGIDASHPEFGHLQLGQTLHFADVPENGAIATGGAPRDAGKHGTHVCGLIAGRTVGVAPGVALAVASVLNINSEGKLIGTRAQIARGLNWLLTTSFAPDAADDPGVHIINLSLGAPGFDDYLLAPITTARLAGTLTIGAIGNYGQWGPDWHGSPGNYPVVVGVGAIDRQNEVAAFSDWSSPGSGVPKPDICAPGVGVCSAVPGGGYELMDGTSMATPILSGAAALLLERHPNMKLNPPLLEAALYAQCTQPPTQPRGGRGRFRL